MMGGGARYGPKPGGFQNTLHEALRSRFSRLYLVKGPFLSDNGSGKRGKAAGYVQLWAELTLGQAG